MNFVKEILEIITLENLYYLFTILVVFDVVTGICKAWRHGRLKSRTLRDGLFGSIGEMLALILCIIVAKLIPITTVVVGFLLIFMNLKELASVCENLLDMGVTIIPKCFISGLKVYTDKLDNLNPKEIEINEEVKK